MDNPLHRAGKTTSMNADSGVHVKINFNEAVLSVDDKTSAEQTATDLYRYKLRRFIESIGFRLTIALLFISDIIIIIISIAQKEPSYKLNMISTILSVIFVMHISLHIVAQGLIVGVRLFRLVHIIRTIRILQHREHFKTGSRHLVGQNKKRTIGNGFDLDLCAISDRIIAMSFPSKGKDAFFRNDIVDVGHYLDITYGNHYRVYNLCSERFYDTTFFHNRVERILIDDHNVPRLNDMIRMADSVTAWFEENEKNVIAVYCKGGKGRTGTMISVALLRTGICETAEKALDLFAEGRTDLRHGKQYQGVETPSQTRYVGYYDKILHI
ncbi:unnamed protein product, partial [Adineta steineri]